MLHQVQNDDSPSRLENAPGLGNRALRMQGVMQGLAEQHEVHGSVVNGYGFKIALAILQCRQALRTRQGSAQFHHPVGIVYGDHLVRPLGKQDGESTLAGS